MQRCRIIRCDTAGCESKWCLLYCGISILVCLVCLSRLWCAATMFTKYCGSRALEKHSSLCAKLIVNRDQLVKYLGFPLPELEIISPICAKGCRKIRDAQFLEDIWYAVYLLISLLLHALINATCVGMRLYR